MRIAITGANGFLGWHLACRIRAVLGVEPVRLTRHHVTDDVALRESLCGVDVVFHVAGVNRADTDHEVERGNIDIARKLERALSSQIRPVNLVYANTIHADQNNAYGRGKSGAGQVLETATRSIGGTFSDVMLPNLFGEHGRPAYNSFVATFINKIVSGAEPLVKNDRELPMMHAQVAAQTLIDAAGQDGVRRVSGELRSISGISTLLQSMYDSYAPLGEIPPLATEFELDLFNTLRAATFPTMWPIRPHVHRDDRGDLFETVRSRGKAGMSFVSTTKPGQTRGEHYHLRKIERFFVLKGKAEINLRRLLHDDVITLRMDGGDPGFVDMPTMWVHNIRNIGDDELVTMFWSNQLHDPAASDQYPERVGHAGGMS